MGVSYIWRDNASRASASDKISFETANITDDQGHIHQLEFKITTALADNEKPNAKLNELQDTQVDSITVVVTGSIHNWQTAGASGTQSTIPDKIKSWMCDKKSTSSFSKGRFGLELYDFPSFNVNPSSTLGYMIQDWTWIRDGDISGKTSFIATLRLNGTILTSGTDENGTYTWWS
jgi:hypothetical protein